MISDQIAVQTLKIQELQLWITAIAIFLGPLLGVIFTFWFQKRKEQRDAKLQLFLTLMSERKSLFISKETTKALNQIDIVFSNNSKVKSLWHKYYGLLSQPFGEQHTHSWLELLAELANDLGYKSISQVDLDKFYIPQGHIDNAEIQKKLGNQLNRVLEKTERFLVEPRID